MLYIVQLFFFFNITVFTDGGNCIVKFECFLDSEESPVNIVDFAHVTIGKNCMRSDYIAAQPFA